jgi:hypothetical protein
MFTFLHVNPTLVSWMNHSFRIFNGKNGPNLLDSKANNSKLPDFYEKFQYVAKNIERFCFFLFSYLQFSQIWLNHFPDNCHFCYITRSFGKSLGWISIFREKIQTDLYNKIKLVHFKFWTIRFRGTTHHPRTM